MLEFILTLLSIVCFGLFGLICVSVFVAYITQAQYIDEHGFGDNDDD
jgi:hypothetical protein